MMTHSDTSIVALLLRIPHMIVCTIVSIVLKYHCSVKVTPSSVGYHIHYTTKQTAMTMG